jgi:hypothetical protein
VYFVTRKLSVSLCVFVRLKLVEVLDIDNDWRMHLVSDGQRRRGHRIAWWPAEPPADVRYLMK